MAMFYFEVKFDLEVQNQLTAKTIGILTKVFCSSGANLVILAWTGDKLSHGQASDYHTHRCTHRQTQPTTIPEGQNWPRVKIKMLNGTARNHRMAIPALACGFFLWRMGRIYFFFFFTFKRKLWKVVPYHEIWVPRTWYDYTPPGHGKWYEKIFITSDFHILPKQSHIGAGNIPFRCISSKTAFQSVCVDPLTGNWNCL